MAILFARRVFVIFEMSDLGLEIVSNQQKHLLSRLWRFQISKDLIGPAVSLLAGDFPRGVLPENEFPIFRFVGDI